MGSPWQPRCALTSAVVLAAVASLAAALSAAQSVEEVDAELEVIETMIDLEKRRTEVLRKKDDFEGEMKSMQKLVELQKKKRDLLRSRAELGASTHHGAPRTSMPSRRAATRTIDSAPNVNEIVRLQARDFNDEGFVGQHIVPVGNESGARLHGVNVTAAAVLLPPKKPRRIVAGRPDRFLAFGSADGCIYLAVGSNATLLEWNVQHQSGESSACVPPPGGNVGDEGEAGVFPRGCPRSNTALAVALPPQHDGNGLRAPVPPECFGASPSSCNVKDALVCLPAATSMGARIRFQRFLTRRCLFGERAALGIFPQRRSPLAAELMRDKVRSDSFGGVFIVCSSIYTLTVCASSALPLLCLRYGLSCPMKVAVRSEGSHLCAARAQRIRFPLFLRVLLATHRAVTSLAATEAPITTSVMNATLILIAGRENGRVDFYTLRRTFVRRRNVSSALEAGMATAEGFREPAAVTVGTMALPPRGTFGLATVVTFPLPSRELMRATPAKKRRRRRRESESPRGARSENGPSPPDSPVVSVSLLWNSVCGGARGKRSVCLVCVHRCGTVRFVEGTGAEIARVEDAADGGVVANAAAGKAALVLATTNGPRFVSLRSARALGWTCEGIGAVKSVVFDRGHGGILAFFATGDGTIHGVVVGRRGSTEGEQSGCRPMFRMPVHGERARVQLAAVHGYLLSWSQGYFAVHNTTRLAPQRPPEALAIFAARKTPALCPDGADVPAAVTAGSSGDVALVCAKAGAVIVDTLLPVASTEGSSSAWQPYVIGGFLFVAVYQWFRARRRTREEKREAEHSSAKYKRA